ncbi:MAG: phosphatidylserine decarboxylase [Alphaproteobacteria bacterium]|nr:phosphatidylserine decarboxylase [Alphaproteobacteria bacterium]
MKSVDTSLHGFLFPTISQDGWKFVSIMAVFTLIAAMIWFPLGCISFILTVWCFYSFRDPVRVTPVLSTAVVAPADGYIVSITHEKGPDAVGLQNKNFTKICIYNTPFDAHYCRSPIRSRIAKTFYDAGKPFTKSFDKNNLGNEKYIVALKQSENFDFVVQQIATFCNKRILNNFKLGDEFTAGQRLGFLRFGGYVEIFLPDKVQPIVCVGQKVVAGETIIANINSDAPRMEGEIR